MSKRTVTWIPAGKKWPKNNQRVLVCWKARGKIYVDVGTYNGDGRWWLEDGYDNQPTHWAAMPSPPQVRE